jgi:hypothetical protein
MMLIYLLSMSLVPSSPLSNSLSLCIDFTSMVRYHSGIYPPLIGGCLGGPGGKMKSRKAHIMKPTGTANGINVPIKVISLAFI